MKQSGKGIQNANLQEFLESAANANQQGQQQFYTPRNLAEALARPLPAVRSHLVMDLHFGSGSLAAGSGAKTALGLDIDARVVGDLDIPEGCEWLVQQSDLTRWFPIAADAGFTAPFILINPPFSLKWYSDRLAPLRRSHIPEVAAVATGFGEHVDSTLASFLIALHLLHTYGEGYMVCNADTARRYFGSPDGSTVGKHPDLQKFIWMWMDIPEPIFENQNAAFDTAVLWFSASHGRNYAKPLHLRSPSKDPLAVQSTLFNAEVFQAHKGSRLKYESEFLPKSVIEKFELVNSEYLVRHGGRRPAWNIQIDEKGRLRTHLTPFQHVSKSLDRNLIAKLHALDKQTPISLCVTATSRTALREAADCGVWTIHPAVESAISQALLDYETEGAPFYTPNEVQSLGWIDEHSRLTCMAAGIGSCQPGGSYLIQSTIEKTQWKGKRINLVGEEESLDFNGRELLVTLTDDDGLKHHFHVRKDGAKVEDATNPAGEVSEKHWHIEDLIRHFRIPIPPDLATIRRPEYERNLTRIEVLEDIVNANLAAA